MLFAGEMNEGKVVGGHVIVTGFDVLLGRTVGMAVGPVEGLTEGPLVGG